VLSNLGICRCKWKALDYLAFFHFLGTLVTSQNLEGSRLPRILPFPRDFGYESELKFLSIIISFLFHTINFGTRVVRAVSVLTAEFTGFTIKYCVFHL